MELLLEIQKVLTIPSFWNWVKYWYKKIALMRMKLFRGKKFKNEINFQLLMDSITYVHEFDPSIGSLSEAQRVQALLFLSLQNHSGLTHRVLRSQVVIPPEDVVQAERYTLAQIMALSPLQFKELARPTDDWIEHFETCSASYPVNVEIRITRDTRVKDHIVIETGSFTSKELSDLLAA